MSSSEIYIGLMSGTSLDGVDIAVVDFSSEIPNLIYCATRPYEVGISQRIRDITVNPAISLDELCQLDVELGQIYAGIVNQSLESAAIGRTNIQAIGSHGQTIQHRPDLAFPYSLQIGDPNVISAQTGITCVADFRRKDVALGGQGAPLAPAFHQYLFSSSASDRAIINIGGIANITYLPASGDPGVIGFDTGPGNTLLDYWVRQNMGVAYDGQGKWAASGAVIDSMLEEIMSTEPYFKQDFPKSTGTEYLNSKWLSEFIKPEFNPVDIQATLVELTAHTIALGINQLPKLPAECYLCGGGAYNHYLVERLAAALPDCQIKTTETLGLHPDFVEAVAFAWLARQTMNKLAGNLPGVTHAESPVVLGGVYYATPENEQ